MQSTLDCNDGPARRHHHGRQRPLGLGARAAALGRTPRRRRVAPARLRSRPGVGRGDAHRVRLLVRQLAAAARRGAHADGPAAPLSADRDRAAERQRHPADRHRPPRPVARRPGGGRSPPRKRTPHTAKSLHLRIALDYSARDAILQRGGRVGARHRAHARTLRPPRQPASRRRQGRDVDLLIRTGGEKRLSDFLLWECAYAELYFTDRMWPDFDADDLAIAIGEFHRRERRFGAVPNTTEPVQPVPSAA